LKTDTSRRVADRAGLKPQLVHYYFRTMDEMFIEVFRRRATQGLDAPAATRLTMEYMGLANHRKALRAEIALYAERFREQQVEAITSALRRYGYEVCRTSRRWCGGCSRRARPRCW
jgi:AcrR family transcriptional regulator